jgi:hypothetical protein
MRSILYLLYGMVVISVCTWIDARTMQRYNSAPRSWSSGSGSHGTGSTGPGAGGWSGGAAHK